MRGRHRVEIGGRLVGKADEEQARDAAQMHGLQAVAARVEIRAHMLGEEQPAVLRS